MPTEEFQIQGANTLSTDQVKEQTVKIAENIKENPVGTCIGCVNLVSSNGTAADHHGVLMLTKVAVLTGAFEFCISLAILPDVLQVVVAEKVTCNLDSGASLNCDGNATCSITLESIEDCCKEHAKSVKLKVEDGKAVACNTCCKIKEITDKLAKDGDTGEDEGDCSSKDSDKAIKLAIDETDVSSDIKQKETTEARPDQIRRTVTECNEQSYEEVEEVSDQTNKKIGCNTFQVTVMGVVSATSTAVRSPSSTDAPASPAAVPTTSVSRESCADPVMAGSYTFAATSRTRLLPISTVMHHLFHYSTMTLSSATALTTSAVTVVSVKSMSGNWSLSVAVGKSLNMDVSVCSELLHNYDGGEQYYLWPSYAVALASIASHTLPSVSRTTTLSMPNDYFTVYVTTSAPTFVSLDMGGSPVGVRSGKYKSSLCTLLKKLAEGSTGLTSPVTTGLPVAPTPIHDLLPQISCRRALTAVGTSTGVAGMPGDPRVLTSKCDTGTKDTGYSPKGYGGATDCADLTSTSVLPIRVPSRAIGSRLTESGMIGHDYIRN